MSDQILDLRTLADEWNDAIEELNESTNESASYGELADINGPYEHLCDQLGIEMTPDALQGYANDYESTLIREDYFKEYAQELAEDIGAIDHNASWPMSCIDWDQAARELAMDYTMIQFDGEDYYIRA